MKSKFVNIIAAVQALAALVLLGAMKLWAPVCSRMLSLADGGETHMKCFYTGQTALALGVILLIASIMCLLSKADHRKIQFIIGAGGILLFLLCSSLIGVCRNPEMPCVTTAVWIRAVALVTVAGSAAALCSRDTVLPE